MLIHLEKLGKSFGEKVVLHDVSASVEKEDRIGIVGQNGAGKTTLLKILTGVYTDYDGEFSVTHGVTLGYLEQNAKLDATLDIYGEMRSSFAPVLDAMAQMQILEKKMAASPDDAALLEKHDELQNIIDAADGYNMDVNIKKVLSGMGFAQDTWQKNIAVLSGGELSRIMLALRNVLTAGEDVGMLIFDEIDTGVSGHAAQQIGRKLSAIAKKKQTLCVTHLPQIAAMGDHHLRISKSVRDGRSYTDVSPMDRAHRVDEIARLLSGEEISDAARRNAEELLDAAGQGA